MGELNRQRAEQFAGRMVGVLNNGFLTLMTSIGHQTGLFDGMAKLPLSNSAGIADACGLNERYVREWLGAMAAAKVVDYDAAAGTYYFPREHAASLTRAASSTTSTSAGRNSSAYSLQVTAMKSLSLGRERPAAKAAGRGWIKQLGEAEPTELASPSCRPSRLEARPPLLQKSA